MGPQSRRRKMPPRPADFKLQIIIIGSRGVGKTSLMERYTDDTFCEACKSTVGVDFKIKTVELREKKIRLQIWDTAGQERFRTITTAYYRGAMGIMLVYDICNEKSFDNIKNWIRNIEEHASSDVEKMILGNKCDMTDRRQVSKDRGEKLAIDYGVKFLETSAKSGLNVEEAFYTMARDILHNLCSKATDSSGEGSGKPVKITDKKSKRIKFFKCSLL
uniref:Ras-related protein SEC4 n=5 Tax=Nothobranchius TaxID=28779 RepID=A0A1A8K6D4_NOTKU